MLKRYLKRVPHAVRGLTYGIKHDFGFRTQVYATFVVATIVLFIFNPITITEFLFLGTAAILIMITELQNSAIEAALDRLHPEIHESIKRSKDMAAGAVLLAALYAFLVLILLLGDRFLF